MGYWERIRYRSAEQVALFEELCKKIDASIQNNEGVFVHCVRGRSRSVGVVMCYLIYAKKMTTQEALNFIMQRRPCIDPVHSIQTQAKQFENYCAQRLSSISTPVLTNNVESFV